MLCTLHWRWCLTSLDRLDAKRHTNSAMFWLNSSWRTPEFTENFEQFDLPPSVEYAVKWQTLVSGPPITRFFPLYLTLGFCTWEFHYKNLNLKNLSQLNSIPFNSMQFNSSQVASSYQSSWPHYEPDVWRCKTFTHYQKKSSEVLHNIFLHGFWCLGVPFLQSALMN